MNLIQGLSGQRILEEVDSRVNGHIRVVKDLAFGTYIQVNGLTQSGGVIESIWGKTLKKIRKSNAKMQNVLILGLGGGTAAKLVRKYWPDSMITGVDIDPTIVELGEKYLSLKDTGVETIIGDALAYCKNHKKKFDLIIVDTYCGYDFPAKFESEEFLKNILKSLSDKGIAVFNRLYFKDKRGDAVRFGSKLEKIFPKVEWFYPEANLMFITSLDRIL